jgi:hypothetical protein
MSQSPGMTRNGKWYFRSEASTMAQPRLQPRRDQNRFDGWGPRSVNLSVLRPILLLRRAEPESTIRRKVLEIFVLLMWFHFCAEASAYALTGRDKN